MKATIGVLLTTLSIILGLVGVLMAATNNFPPDFILPPWVSTVMVIVGILVAGLGWQDELTGGRDTIIDLVKRFFSEDPFRKLALTVILTVAREVIALPDASTGLVTGAQIFLAVAAVFSFIDGKSDFKVSLLAKRAGLK